MSIDTNPASNAAGISPSDTADLTDIRALYIGIAGTLKVDMVGGGTVTFAGASGFLPIRVKRVYATGTNADSIVGLY